MNIKRQSVKLLFWLDRVSLLGFLLFFIPINGIIAQIENDPEMYQRTEKGLILTETGASHFAKLALDCIHKEYPNKLNQVLKDETNLLPPKTLHPAFYGCFDWHSSVHGHWMLVKLLKEFPDIPERSQILDGIQSSLLPENIRGEVEYFQNASSSWERMYGWAWLLQLALELNTWDEAIGEKLSRQLDPLTQVIRNKYIEFLPKQDYPIRTGVHPNTAFGLSFAYDYAVSTEDSELINAILEATERYYSKDEDCPLSWEPGGEDFLSPCLEEAALMARVMPGKKYYNWLKRFLPTLNDPKALKPANVSDRSDPKIVHLDGLNLSRAWNLYIIAYVLDDKGLSTQMRSWAEDHLSASLPHVASEHYEGSHWLGSFAVYALTRNN